MKMRYRLLVENGTPVKSKIGKEVSYAVIDSNGNSTLVNRKWISSNISSITNASASGNIVYVVKDSFEKAAEIVISRITRAMERNYFGFEPIPTYKMLKKLDIIGCEKLPAKASAYEALEYIMTFSDNPPRDYLKCVKTADSHLREKGCTPYLVIQCDGDIRMFASQFAANTCSNILDGSKLVQTNIDELLAYIAKAV